ncbi:MAG: serine hydrolase, partial [Candidatus Pacearchaeota archaeon]|nr:serine hydrolase [Candidatus Pacearchaeota archaeon]
KELSVKELLHYMLAESDNTAAGALQTNMTKSDMVQLTDYMDFYSNNISAEQIPIKATYITPKTVYNMFASLYLSTMLNIESSELILKELTNTSFDIKKYANLPSDVVVSQKFGEEDINYKVFHSCGIIYVSDSRFFYCIMTKNIGSTKSPEVIGAIVNKLYNFIVDNRKVSNLTI